MATEAESPTISKTGFLQSAGKYLGLPFAESNPQKVIKSSDMPLGNLPLEILAYIAAFLDYTIENGQLKVPMQQTVACESLYSPFTIEREARSDIVYQIVVKS